MSLIFYTNPMSRGQIARWMLEEAGAGYEQRLIQYGPEMKGEAYRAINPMGKVPAIVHDGKVVTECAAICAYVAEAFPEAGLAPRPHERADYYRWMFFAAGPLEQAVINHAMGWESPEEKQATLGYGSYQLASETLAAWLGDREYICGDRFTAADVYVGAQVDWGQAFGTLPALPAFVAYAARLRSRPAYVRAKAIDNDLIEAAKAAETQGVSA
jgi:glutathione S-transferase